MSEKASGLRQPSKIGRPCCANVAKPSIPLSPSRTSLKSMEPIYENPSRKDSGHRRGSDTSVILTEDTDSFIIGDRVWVGGTKPGSIAYIGETQFAPGDWAGVVLDEPIGKNDGSVAGFRYFQCAPKHGIFSRLTRLTRSSLGETSILNDHQVKTPISPDGRLNKSVTPSLNTSMTSLTSSSCVSHRDIKIGERVIISSSQGSKTGVLRFIGDTEFANGEWCGVELDDPIGKNDGSVGDKRYFECRKNYGLFAPLHKVTRSPSNKRSSISYKPIGAALNSSLRRTSSKESLTSMTSMASTTASNVTKGGTPSTARRTGLRTSTPGRSSLSLQEMLKEKQQEIEMLKKDRDLERERITKAANQVDHAEQAMVKLQKEYNKYRDDMEKNLLEIQTTLSKVMEEKNQLLVQLEEERQKCEDLLFRFDEESVNKEDIERKTAEQNVINTLNESKIKDLESQLAGERERVIQLEKETTRLFELEEELVKLKSEKTEFLELQNRNWCLEEAKITLEKQMLERNDSIEMYIKQIKDLEVKLNSQETENSLTKDKESHLLKTVEEFNQTIEEKNSQLVKLKQEYESNVNTMKDEIKSLKEEIENIKRDSVNEKELIVSDYKKIIELMKLKMKEYEDEMTKNLQGGNESLDKLNQLTKDMNKKLNEKDAKVNELHEQLKNNLAEVDKLKDELANQRILLQTKEEELKKFGEIVDDLNKKLELNESDKEKLRNETEQMKLKFENELKIVNDDKTKVDEALSLQLINFSELTEDLSNKTMKLNSLEKDLNEMKLIIDTKNDEINNLMEKKSELTDGITFSEQTKTNLESELRMYEVNIAELNQKNIHSEEKILQLTEQKNKLQNEIDHFITTSSNSSEQLIKYNDDLRLKEKEIEQFRERIFELENCQTSSQAKLTRAEDEVKAANQLIDQLKTASGDLKDELDVQMKVKNNLTIEINNLKLKEEELSQLIKSNETLVGELNVKSQEINKLNEKLKVNEENLCSLEATNATLVSSNNEQAQLFNKQINDLEEKIKTLQNNQMKLLEEKESAEQLLAQLNLKFEDTEKLKRNFEDLNVKKDDVVKSLENNIKELVNEKQSNDKIVDDLNDKCRNLQTKVDEYLNKEKQLSGKVNELEGIVAEKSKDSDGLHTALEDVKVKMLNLEKDNKEFLDQINGKDNEIISLKDQLKNIEITLNDKVQSVDLLNKQIESLKINQNQSQNDIENSYSIKLKERDSDVEKLTNEVDAIKKDKLILEGNVKQLSIDLSNKDEMLLTLKNDMDSMKSEYDKLIVINNDSKQLLELKEKDMNDIKTVNNNLLTMKESLEVNLKNSDEKINNLKDSEKLMNDSVNKLENESQLLRENQKILEKVNEDLIIKLNEALNELKTVNENKKNVNESVDTTLTNNLVNNTDVNYTKLIEDNDLYKGQIDFLNSVIVDMKKKNEKLTCKIQVLEMGIPSNEADDYTFKTFDKNNITPRMFCDICDQFDLHETEDCPKQSQDFHQQIDNNSTIKNKKKQNIERPYCENCEMFGHDTANCDDTETF